MEELKHGPLTLERVVEDGVVTLTVTGCDKEVKEIEIPSEVGGVPVTLIGDYAFEDCICLEKVSFAEPTDEHFEAGHYLREAGVHIFMRCLSLRKIAFPWYMRHFGWGTFNSCTALEEVECDPGTYFSGYSFAHCTSLRRITPLRRLSEGIFSHCAALTSLPVTNRVSEIPEDAFEHCDSLIDVTIPASVTEIGALAFRGCYELKRVTFEQPDGWYSSNSYRTEDVSIDVDDPEDNAKCLAWMDFDDGVRRWYRKKS